MSGLLAGRRGRLGNYGRAALVGVVAGFFVLPLVGGSSMFSGDWATFMMGGTLFIHQAASLYDPAVQRPLEEAIAGGVLAPGQAPAGYLVFNPPPWVAMLNAAYVPLGTVLGGRLWMVTQAAAIVAGMYLLAREAPDRWRWVAAVATVPTAVLLLNLQVDGLVVLGLGLGWHLWRRDRGFLAGLALGLCLVKPHLVLPLGLAVVLFRQWRVALGWGLALALLAGAVTLRSPNLVADWVRFSAGYAGHIGAEYALVGLVYAFGLTSRLALGLSLAAILAALALVVGLAWARRRERSTAVAILIAGGVLAAPHALGSDLVLLAAAAAVWPRTRWYDWVAISAGALVIVVSPAPYSTVLALLLQGGLLYRMARAPASARGLDPVEDRTQGLGRAQ